VRALFGVYGAERDACYASAKIALNMHFFDGGPFEVVRVSYLLANSKFVVSESSPGDSDQTEIEGGLALASYDELVETCAHYLQMPSERQRIAQARFSQMKARPMDRILRAALAELE
jgi:hypothetical protein